MLALRLAAVLALAHTASSLAVVSLPHRTVAADDVRGVHIHWKLQIDGADGAADEVQQGWELRVQREGVVLQFASSPSSPDAFCTLHPNTAVLSRRGPLQYAVRVRATTGAWSSWSSSAVLHVGPGSSRASWGGPFPGAPAWLCTTTTSSDVRSSMLRADFTLTQPVSSLASATAYVIGLGTFGLLLNGAQVSNDRGGPGWTAWNKTLLYSTYDLLAERSLKDGLNGVGLRVGNGFYNVLEPGGGRYTKFVQTSLATRMALLMLELVYSDGSSFTFSTSTMGGAWTATDGGRMTFSHQYAGEDWSAALETPGWAEGGFDPTSNPLVPWTAAVDCSGLAPLGRLQPAAFDPVRVMRVLQPLNVTSPSPAPGVTLVDLGINFAGYPQINVSGVPPGATLRLWPSETLASSGIIDQSSGGTPMYWQYRTLNGSTNSDVSFAPDFGTYGFRWLAVEFVGNPTSSASSNGTVSVMRATYGANCSPSLRGDATSAVAAACNGQAACEYPVCTCGDNTCPAGGPPCLPDPAQNCAKDFSVEWSCSLDPPGVTRTTYLPPEADNSIAIVTCFPQPPPPPFPNVTGVVGHFTRSSVRTVGTFNCSDGWVNAIHAITLEAIEANLQSVNTDCPHRERLGWLETSWLLFPSIAYSFDISDLWAKIALDTVDSQTATGMVPDIAPEYTVFSGGFRDSPEWGSASIQNAAFLSSWYGNTAIVNATWDTATSYASYLLSKRDAASGLLTYGLGDWIPVVPSPAGVTGTAVLVQDLQALAVGAAALGQGAAAANYTALAGVVSAAYARAFSTGGSYPTQCAAGFALELNITATGERGAALAYIMSDASGRGNVTTAGEIGNRYVLRSLAAEPSGEGMAILWASLHRRTSPGYGWMLVRGETALAESWDDAPGDSHIHSMYGHIDEVLYAYVAGIRQVGGGSGWREVLLAPVHVEGLLWVNATFDSPRGLFASAYVASTTSDGRRSMELTLTVPAGVRATAVLPLSGARVALRAGRTTVLTDAESSRG